MACSSSEAQIPAPIAYWSFDNDPGVQINDLTGNSNSGGLFNTSGIGGALPSFSNNVPAALGSGSSLQFTDASQHYAALDMSFSGAGALPQFTATAWFNTTWQGPPTGSVQQNNWAILDFDRSDYFNVYVRDTDGAIGFSTNSGGIDDQVSTTTGLNDGSWHHVAVVYDGTDKRVYVDGALSGTATNPHGGSPVGSANARFGTIGDGSESTSFNGARNNLYYDGFVDDVAVWNTVLNPTDIAALANGSASISASLNALPEFPLAGGPQTIDFSSLAGVPENSLISNRIAGMTFDGATLVFPGDPRFGFGSSAGGDAPQASELQANGGPLSGGAMITDLADVNATPDPVGGSPFNTIFVNWNGREVEDLEFFVVDVDGNHQLRARVFDELVGGSLLDEIIINAGDPGTGDGIATLVSFIGITGIERLEVEVENVGGNNSGFALDDFSFNVLAIPEPTSIAIWSLIGLGLAGFVYYRARHKK